MELNLIEYLMQVVDEYNEVQKDESLYLDWWEVVDSIDEESESTIKTRIAEIQSQILAINIKERMAVQQ